jgi:hypothetical protein
MAKINLRRVRLILKHLWCVTAAALVFCSGTAVAFASTLRISTGSNSRLSAEVEADYTTSHIFINEVAGESLPITVFFDPQVPGVQSAEVFTNLNRRQFAILRGANNFEEGINPPSGDSIVEGDDKHYYKAYRMTAMAAGGYQLTLSATKCGVYRLTARYHLSSDPPGTYHWYGTELNASGIPKRDHVIVISPGKARAIQLYEANPLTIIATGTAADQRGTFADLAAGLPGPAGPRFSLAYVKSLGCNMLWLQPIHPRGIDGRQTDPATQQPYELGSPYSVKNFFAVMPLMAKAFKPGNAPQSNDTPAGRAQAMSEFRQFVRNANAKGIDVMLDAPFNHTAHDVELSRFGQQYWGSSTSIATTEIRTMEARFFSRVDAYDMRANSSATIAVAPDRYDFGKWSDVYDVYFGRYAALVPNRNEQQAYRSEGDWFDYSVGDESAAGEGNGHFDAITASVWRYFGDYLQFWLTETGYPRNSVGATLNSPAGIDGIRADFAQGLPPQCWEYIINRTRARKWDFVFMAESLDGGPVTYRSARQFDVLNENLIYDLYQATTASDFRRIYDQRRTNYGAGLVLLNTSSQDEDNYKDPFEALVRFAANSTIDGVPMIFPGQELGLAGTIVPPNRSNPAAGPPFGYERYEAPFFGKPIPSFMTFNSMMPLWRRLAANEGSARQLLDLYSAIDQARTHSRALRGSNRVFLDLLGNVPQQKIFGIAKFEKQNANPNSSDVVFAFVNLTPSVDEETPSRDWFNVNVDLDHNGVNDFGIEPDRFYNVKNIAAYTGVDSKRRQSWVWAKDRLGSDLLENGIYVHLNKVPSTVTGWTNAPYEAQFLKLYDVTPKSNAREMGRPREDAKTPTTEKARVAASAFAQQRSLGPALSTAASPCSYLRSRTTAPIHGKLRICPL